MPIRRFKKAVGKRRYRRKTSWYNKRYSALQLAGKAWKGLKYVKSLINVERKFFDVQQNTDNILVTGTVYNLSNIAQGNDYNNRDGNSILLQSLLLRWTLAASSTDPAGDVVRLIIFQDNDQRGTDPTPANLLEDVSSGLYAINSPLLHTVNRRFNVLMDKRIATGAYQTTATQAVSTTGHGLYILGKKYLKFKNNHIKYTSTAGADASNYEGSLYLLTICRNQTTTIGFHSRIRFTDN